MLSKIRLVLSILGLVILGALILFTVLYFKQLKETERYKGNYEAVVKDRSLQQELTYKEFKYLYNDYVAQLKELRDYGVKLKNVENLIHVNYFIKDSTIYKDTLIPIYDTIKDYYCSDFTINADCWSIAGSVENNNVIINEHTSQDSILVVLYKQKRKCLFEKRRVRAIVYSQCSGDTLAIINNLKLIKAH